jgi:hypothetical protein
MWSSVIKHDDLGVVWNSRSLQAELLVKLACNPILQACYELIPGTLGFVLRIYFSTLCHPFVLGNFGQYAQDILAFPLVTEKKVQKITVNEMLVVVRSALTLKINLKFYILKISYVYDMYRMLYMHTNTRTVRSISLSTSLLLKLETIERRKMRKQIARLFTHSLEKHVTVQPSVDRIGWTQGVPETCHLVCMQTSGEKD